MGPQPTTTQLTPGILWCPKLRGPQRWGGMRGHKPLCGKNLGHTKYQSKIQPTFKTTGSKWGYDGYAKR